MKAFFKSLAVAATVAVTMAGAAGAATVYSSTVAGNDPFPGPLMGSPSLAKCDMEAEGNVDKLCDDWEDGASAGDYSTAFSLTYTSETAFDWVFTPGNVIGELLYPTKIAVKAGPRYHIYDVALGDTSGSADIFADSGFGNAISHVSFYDTGLGVIPLPAAGWMLLAGIGGMAALRRRKKS